VSALVVGMLAFPATAGAVGVSVTGDDGQPQGLNGQTIRNMAPQLRLVIEPNDAFVSLSVTGPTGQPAATPYVCTPVAQAVPKTVSYQGNGIYSVMLSSYAASDPTCTQPVTAFQTPATFVIGAGVTLGTDPNTPLLTRDPGESTLVEHRIPLQGNPGANAYDVSYSSNPAIRASGGLVGPSHRGHVDPATSTIPLRFSRPGSYTVVARARTFGGARTPWSRPLTLRVFAPFDFSSSSFPDARGPTYRLQVQIRERKTRGRVSIAYARGWTGRATYHSLGRASISSKATFTKRFRLARTGQYRIRYRFGGSTTTAAGTVVEKVRIRRSS
jgi:hypothetical protein